MRILEVTDPSSTKLAALSQFLLGRARDTSAQRSISTTAFLNLAREMGVVLTLDQLINLSQQPPLSNIIATMNQTEVKFIDSTESGQAVSNASRDARRDQQIVDKMAKRASKNATSALK